MASANAAGSDASELSLAGGNAPRSISSYRWLILLVGVITQTGLSIPGQGIPTMAYFFQLDMSLSRVQLGTFSTAMSFGALVSLIGAGLLADRVGIRKLLLIGQLIIGCSVISMGFTHSYLTALLALLPVGLGTGLVNPAITKAIMYWFEPRMRGTAMSAKQTGVPLGGAVAAATLPAIAFAYGWRSGVIALGAVIILSGLVSFFIYREYPAPGHKAPVARPRGGSMLAVFKNKNLIIGSLICCPLAAVHFAVVTYFILFVKETLLFPVVAAAMFLSLTQLSGVGGRIAWGFLSDYVFGGSRRTTMLVITSIATASVLGAAILPVGAPGWLIALVAIALGTTALSWHGVYLTQIGELAGKENAGAAVGLALTVGQIGIMGGPPLFGFLVDQSGPYRFAWLVMAGFTAVSILLAGLVRERAPRAQTIPAV